MKYTDYFFLIFISEMKYDLFILNKIKNNPDFAKSLIHPTI